MITKTNALTGFIALFSLVSSLATPPTLAAHEIPNDVTVQAFVKPSGDRLNLLIRVPLD